jgi:2-iminobutanoate/2-iminopropanoate deaminase
MEKESIYTDNAPAAIGPYSQAIRAGNMLFVSGQIALDTANKGDIVAETLKVMENMGEILKTAGFDYSNIVKTSIFLKDMNQFIQVNEVYARFFSKDFPARETVEVARLPKDVNVEISCIAVKNGL